MGTVKTWKHAKRSGRGEWHVANMKKAYKLWHGAFFHGFPTVKYFLGVVPTRVLRWGVVTLKVLGC